MYIYKEKGDGVNMKKKFLIQNNSNLVNIKDNELRNWCKILEYGL